MGSSQSRLKKIRPVIPLYRPHEANSGCKYDGFMVSEEWKHEYQPRKGKKDHGRIIVDCFRLW